MYIFTIFTILLPRPAVLGLSFSMQDLCHVGSFVKLQSTRFSCPWVGGIKPLNLQPLVLQGRFLTTGPPGKSEFLIIIASNIVSFSLSSPGILTVCILHLLQLNSILGYPVLSLSVLLIFLFAFQFQKFLLSYSQAQRLFLSPVQSRKEPIKGILQFCYSVFDLQHFFFIIFQSLHPSAFIVHLSCMAPTFSIKSSGSVQFSTVAQACPTLCDPMDCSTPGLSVHQQLLEFSNSCPLSW